jgi:hypothetical protein
MGYILFWSLCSIWYQLQATADIFSFLIQSWSLLSVKLFKYNA